MSVNPNRQPKGIPTGGQFAASQHAEAGVGLGPVNPADSTDPWGEPTPQSPVPVPATADTRIQNLRVEDVVWIGGAERLVTTLKPTEDPDIMMVGFDHATADEDMTPFGKDAVVGRVSQAPLNATEFGTYVQASQTLRSFDDPHGRVDLPDGSFVEIIPDPDTLDEDGEVITGIVEEGTYAITRPDGSTSVRGFSDLGERGKVAEEITLAATYAARDRRPVNETPAAATDPAFPEGAVRDGQGTALGPDGTLYRDDPGSFWHGTEIISVYTRSQALADGTLKDRLADGTDLNQMAREAGIPVPVAFTAAAFQDAVAWNDSNRGLQDESGRAWDALWMGARPIRAFAMRNGGNLTVGDRIPFTFIRVPNTPRAEQPRKVEMHAVFGTDENGEPCFTFMMPNED